MENLDRARIFTLRALPQFTRDHVVSSFPGEAAQALLSSKFTVFPGFCDVHVHFREPGFSYKETILTGSLAAARGGYTAVCTMPNLDPVPDSVGSLQQQLDIIKRDAVINVYPYGAITAGQLGQTLSDMDGMSELAAAFTDDGKGVQSHGLMRQAMLKARTLGKIIAAHCEDSTLTNSGYIHDGSYARRYNHKGISSESEWKQVERDLQLAKKPAVHIISAMSPESVDLIRKAKEDGVDDMRDCAITLS